MPSPVCVLYSFFVRLHQYTQRCVKFIAHIVCLALIKKEIAHKAKLVRYTAIPVCLHDLKVFVMNVGADIIIRCAEYWQVHRFFVFLAHSGFQLSAPPKQGKR